MKTEQIVKALEQAARQLGLQVRTEQGNFRGGRCTLDGEEFVILNKRHPPEMHLAILAESLRDQPVDAIYLQPSVRKTLETLWQQRAPLDVEGADAE
jgi:hypothetical protein